MSFAACRSGTGPHCDKFGGVRPEPDPVQKKGDAARPLSRQAAALSLLRRLFLSALRLLRHRGCLPSLMDCGVVLFASALCRLARRPGVVATSLRGLTRARVGATGEQQRAVMEKNRNKKNGVLVEHPEGQSGEITASSRPFSSRPWLPSSPFFSPQVVVTQPPTNHLVVTTGGLSHPPSYQM
jgi:hypothetical protein